MGYAIAWERRRALLSVLAPGGTVLITEGRTIASLRV